MMMQSCRRIIVGRVGHLLLWVAVLPMLLIVVAGCADDDELPTPIDTARQAFLDDPEAFVDEDVVVSTEISRVIGPWALAIEATEDDILVIVPEDAETDEVAVGAEVRVSGSVREFDETEIAAEYGIDLSSEIVEEFDGRPVLVADEIVRFEA